MLREKIVAAAAARFVVIVDDSKYMSHLRGRVPVEVVPFGCERTLRTLAERTSTRLLDCAADADGAPFTTDNGNLVADSDFTDVEDPAALAALIGSVPGVAGHGLFIGMASLVFVGHSDGSVEQLAAPGDTVGYGRIAQLVRAPRLHRGGRGFDPCSAHAPRAVS